jgi:hypothetical protein
MLVISQFIKKNFSFNAEKIFTLAMTRNIYGAKAGILKLRKSYNFI